MYISIVKWLLVQKIKGTHLLTGMFLHVLFYVCQNYIYATWTQYWRKEHKFTFCLVRWPSHLLTYLWDIHVILKVINQQLDREQGYVLGKTHTYIIMQIAGVVYTCIVNFHHGQLSPEDLLYIYIPPYTGSLLHNVLFRIVNIRILSYLVEILRILFFLGGMINNLFYSVRKQRDLLSETEGWECHIYLSRANKSYSIIPCTVSESSSTVTFLYHSLKSYFSLATQNSGWKWDGDRFLNWYLIRFSSNIISR